MPRVVPTPTPGQPIRVVVVAEVRLHRDGLARALALDRRLEVVGVARGAPDAVELIAATAPAVVLVDVTGDRGLAVLQAVAHAAPATAAVAVGLHETEADVIACVEAGAVGYLPHDGSFDDVREVAERVARGEVVLPPAIAGSLLRRLATVAGAAQPPPDADVRLTVREREIASLMGQGLSNKEIASALTIAVPTVKNHVHNILEKLNVSRRGEAAARLR